ncbi:MAG TPA: hypothetical protein VFK36_00600 [Gemmatimonadales bacterium]|nr:hypothetical protein [Gemmatimonadales bacterium]
MRVSTLCLAGVALLCACGDPNALPDPQIENVVDTISISALTGTAIQLPSALSVAGPRGVRTDLSADFDVAFDIRGEVPVFIPRAGLNFPASGLQPGLLRSKKAFAEIEQGETNGYTTRDTVQLAVGDVFVARSRVVCSALAVPLYGKLRVLELDAAARTVTFEILADQNCGYVGLKPGLPDK